MSTTAREEHSHGHSHGSSSRTRLGIVLCITLVVLLAEVIGAVISGSLALLADAGHMLTDVVGLAVAFAGATLALRPANSRRTWGFARAEVLAATAQATLLLVVGLVVFVEGVRRLFSPPEVSSGAMLVFGVIGLLGNAISLAVLVSGSRENLNVRAAILEVANDALGSVAVLLAALVIALTGWLRADAVVSLFIAVLIVPRTLKLLREAISVLLESTPHGLNLDEVRDHLLAVPHVLSVHDLHASSITGSLPVLTAHVVLADSCFEDGHAPRILDELQTCLTGHFPISIEHSTFQLEPQVHANHENPAHA